MCSVVRRTMILRILALLVSFQEPRVPVPDAIAVREAEKLVHDVFKDDFARKDPPGRRLLAERLAKQALETRDEPAVRYVLWRESAALSAEAGEVAAALRASDEIIKSFDVNGREVRKGILEKLKVGSLAPAQAASLAEAYLALSTEASADDDFDTAGIAAKEAESLAQKSKSIILASKARARAKEIADARQLSGKIMAARKVLETRPDDPEANCVVGRHLAIAKGDWKAGLGMLSKGGDEKLKALALLDLAGADDLVKQVAIGDGWWDLPESGAAKTAVQARAGYWYAKALPALTGLSRLRIEKRLSEAGLAEGEPKRSGRSAAFDPVGIWTKQDTGTQFYFKAGGVLETPKSINSNARSGKWERVKDTIALIYPGLDRIELQIVDNDFLSGNEEFWKLKRNN